MTIKEKRDGRVLSERTITRTFDTHEEGDRWEGLLSESIRSAKNAYADGKAASTRLRENIDFFIEDRWASDGIEFQRQNELRSILNRMADFFAGPKKDIRIDAITQRQLKAWAAKRLRTKIRRSTIKKDFSALKAFANWAAEWKFSSIDIDVLKYRFRDMKGKQVAGESRQFTVDEWSKIVQQLNKDYPHVALPLWAMALFGVRGGACFDLAWSDVAMPKQADGSIRFRRMKGGHPGAVALPAGSAGEKLLQTARAVYIRQHRLAPGRLDPVFAPIGGRSKLATIRGGWTSSAYSAAVRRSCDSLGIDPRFVAYSTRHSALTWLTRAGVSDHAVQSFAKHTKPGTKQTYIQISGDAAQPASDEVEKLVGSFVDEFYEGEKVDE